MSDLKLASEFPETDDAAWRVLVDKALKGAEYEKTLVNRTADDLTIKPLYTLKDERTANPSGLPGSSPYTRGFRSSKGELPWHIRQLHISTGIAETNDAILADLEGGATAIGLQVSAPGQFGADISSADDMDGVLAGVALDLAGVWLGARSRVSEIAGHLQDVWNRRGIGKDKAIGGFGADPLGALALSGAHPVSLEQAFDELGQLARTTLDEYPDVTAIRVDARPWHGAGGSEAQEQACLCATLVAYLRALEAAGVSPKDALAQMEFSLACDQDFFAGITKMRAARSLIARIAESCGAEDALPGLTLHAMTSFRMFAKHDPQVNMLRTTVACAAAALGGADHITVLPYTFANGQPDAFSRRIARNIQIILQEESSLGAVIDPAGGSWYAEDYTRELAEKAWDIFQRIEQEGGMAEALAKGFIQKMLAETAEQRANEVAQGESELTGVSSFANLAEDTPDLEPFPLPEEIADPAITVEPIPLRRPAEPFEHLRDAADAATGKSGHRPSVALVALGPERTHSERATYARRFFSAGGLDVGLIGADKYDSATSPVACLCGADDVLEAEGSDATKSLKEKGASHILSVGRPGDLRKSLKSAGVDEFIHRGCDMIQILSEAHDHLGLKQR